MAATKSLARNKMSRFVSGVALFCLATFSMIGYQNCMGQQVDLTSTTPGASEVEACSPTADDISGFTAANTDMQNNCVICHGNTSNPASSTFRLYQAGSDTSTAAENLCSIQLMSASTVYAHITSGTSTHFQATSTNAPNLLAYLRSL